MCLVLHYIAFVTLLLALGLVLHHKWKHSKRNRPYVYIEDPVEQWFEAENVLICNLYSHEMWTLILVLSSCVVSVTHIVLIYQGQC